VAEAVRISKTVEPSPPVVPYTWYRYHSEPAPDPHATQLLTPQDAKLQFQYPLTLPGVNSVIIWGDENTNATKEAALSQWLKANAAAFKAPPEQQGLSELAHAATASVLKDAGEGGAAAEEGQGVVEGDEGDAQTRMHDFPRTPRAAAIAEGRPAPAPIARDGPIPPYTSCTL
jgi:hypothetical protein